MKSVLIIDDERFSANHLARLIEKQGFAVFTAYSGEEGVELFRQHRPDIVFLDVLLPGVDGDNVFRYLREIYSGAAIYFMTGRDQVFTNDDALRMGAKGLFPKPIDVAELISLLRRLNGTGE